MLRILCSLLLAFLSLHGKERRPTLQFGSLIMYCYHDLLHYYHGGRSRPVDCDPCAPTYRAANAKERQFYRALCKHFVVDQDQKKRIKQLPKSIFSNDNYKKYLWHPQNWPRKSEPLFPVYYQLVNEISKKAIRNALREIGFEKNVSLPVIHYRLSDVPFGRHPSHHLQSYKFYEEALDWVKSQGIDTSHLIVVTSAKHVPICGNFNLFDLNAVYLNDFLEFLQARGHSVTVQRRSILEDFATMVFAPAFISACGTFSSFAYHANCGVAVPAMIGREVGDRFSTISDLFPITVTPLLHAHVEDYDDAQTVFEQLRGRI